MKSQSLKLKLTALVLLAFGSAAYLNAASPTVKIDEGFSSAVVKEDGSITVPLTANLAAGAPANDVLTVTITGITPTWGTFSVPVGTYDPGSGTWTITLPPGQNLNTSLTFTPAYKSDVDLPGGVGNLQITASAFDPRTSTTATASAEFVVIVDAVAHAPTISVQDASGFENQPLTISLNGVLTNTGGSESITSYQISGVPTGFTINHGINQGSGVWYLSPSDLTNLNVTPTSNFIGSINLSAWCVESVTNISGAEVDFSDNSATSASAPFKLTYSVPEPSTWALLAMGGAGFLILRRRKCVKPGSRFL